jgi:hypothetical protein
MAIELPKPIVGYFEAHKGRSAEAIATCHTPAAVVKDVGQAYTGRDAIRRWKVGSSAKYTCTGEPFSIADEDGRIVVASHLVGDFPAVPSTCATSSSSIARRSPSWRSSHDPFVDLAGERALITSGTAAREPPRWPRSSN